MRIVSILLFLSLTLFAFAVPSGLNLMPTAYSLHVAETRTEFESAGSGKMYVPQGSTILGSQFGMQNGFEMGADQVSSVGLVYNAKFRLIAEGTLMPAISLGAQNIVSGEKPQYYVVASKTLSSAGMLRAHAGFLKRDGETVTMLGASSQIGKIMLKADRLLGDTTEVTAYGAGIDLRGIVISGTRYLYDNGRPDETTFGVAYMIPTIR